jgi:hypothetical protein
MMMFNCLSLFVLLNDNFSSLFFRDCILLCLFILSRFHLNTTSKTLSHSLCIMSLLVSMVLLRVSAYEAIIRQYRLTFILKLLNCVLYEFIYYNKTITIVSNVLHS